MAFEFSQLTDWKLWPGFIATVLGFIAFGLVCMIAGLSISGGSLASSLVEAVDTSSPVEELCIHLTLFGDVVFDVLHDSINLVFAANSLLFFSYWTVVTQTRLQLDHKSQRIALVIFRIAFLVLLNLILIPVFFWEDTIEVIWAIFCVSPMMLYVGFFPVFDGKPFEGSRKNSPVPDFQQTVFLPALATCLSAFAVGMFHCDYIGLDAGTCSDPSVSDASFGFASLPAFALAVLMLRLLRWNLPKVLFLLAPGTTLLTLFLVGLGDLSWPTAAMIAIVMTYLLGVFEVSKQVHHLGDLDHSLPEERLLYLRGANWSVVAFPMFFLVFAGISNAYLLSSSIPALVFMIIWVSGSSG